MNLQISWESEDATTILLTLQLPMGTTFILSFAHPLIEFFWQFSCGSLKNHPLVQLFDVVLETEEEKYGIANVEEKKEKKEEKPQLLVDVEEGLKFYPPEPCDEGVNGTYFIKDKDGKIIAIFKPTDEEGNSENNPKKSLDEEDDPFAVRGIELGEGAIREVAAYRLDRDHFSGVPETIMATLSHPNFCSSSGEQISKLGSLQAFVENDGSALDMGPGRFPVREVHKIGILDVRIFNNDRHSGNVLLRENFENGQIELIPIDHGLSLSSSLDHSWFEWLNWPQAKQPFDEETKEYIRNIDIEKDAALLKEMGFKKEAINTMIYSSILLKRGAAAGLTLFEIGSLVTREELDKPSFLEEMINIINSEFVEDQDRLHAFCRIIDSKIVEMHSKQ